MFLHNLHIFACNTLTLLTNSYGKVDQCCPPYIKVLLKEHVKYRIREDLDLQHKNLSFFE